MILLLGVAGGELATTRGPAQGRGTARAEMCEMLASRQRPRSTARADTYNYGEPVLCWSKGVCIGPWQRRPCGRGDQGAGSGTCCSAWAHTPRQPLAVGAFGGRRVLASSAA